MVWRCLKNGCRGASVVVTQDSRTREEKDGIIKTKRRRRKSNFHAKCHDSDPTHEECNTRDEDFVDTKEEDDIVKYHTNTMSYFFSNLFRSSSTILIHGMDSDWIEEEINDGDGEFLKDILEQKALTAFSSAGIQRKV